LVHLSISCGPNYAGQVSSEQKRIEKIIKRELKKSSPDVNNPDKLKEQYKSFYESDGWKNLPQKSVTLLDKISFEEENRYYHFYMLPLSDNTIHKKSNLKKLYNSVSWKMRLEERKMRNYFLFRKVPHKYILDLYRFNTSKVSQKVFNTQVRALVAANIQIKSSISDFDKANYANSLEKKCNTDNTKACLELAGRYQKKKDYKNVIKPGLIVCKTKHGPACSTVGYAYMKLGDFDKAFKFFRLGCKYKDAISCYNSACELCRMNKKKQAEKAFGIAIKYGFKNKKNAKKDAELNCIKQTKTFKSFISE